MSGQQHGMVALDGAGEVVRPAKLWQGQADTGFTRHVIGSPFTSRDEGSDRVLGVDDVVRWSSCGRA